MADVSDDKLAQLLSEDWEIAGYSTTIMAAGAMTHSVLLRKALDLVTVTVVKNGEKEIGRTVNVLSPMPQKSKGLWG